MNQKFSSVQELAYHLWQARGCPHGSAEADWIEAERQLAQMPAEVAIPEVAAKPVVKPKPTAKAKPSAAPRSGRGKVTPSPFPGAN